MCYTLSRRRRARGDSGGGELHLIEVSEVVRQPERPHEQRLDRVRLLALVVDGVLEAVAVLPYYRLAPPDFFGRNASQDVERSERAVAVGPFRGLWDPVFLPTFCLAVLSSRRRSRVHLSPSTTRRVKSN